MIYKLFIIFIIKLFFLDSFKINPIINNIKTFNNGLENINYIEPYFKNKYNTSACIFFTGGNSMMIPEIYSNFHNNLASNNIAVYTPDYGYNNYNLLIDTLSQEYKEIFFIGHSSGCSIALNKCNNKNIRKLFFLDPVDTRMITKDEFYLKNIELLIIINAGKSYKINKDPFGLPFIPVLKLNKNNLELENNCNVKEIITNNYGHCDILNKPYSNLMHKSRMAVGCKDRSIINLNKYHNWLSRLISNFLIQ